MTSGKKRTRCKLCEKKSRNLSKQGYCYSCSVKKMQEAVQQQVEQVGPIFEKWKKNIIKGAERKGRE